MRSRTMQAIAFIVGYSMFVTAIIGAYWYYLMLIISIDIPNGRLTEQCVSYMFITVGLIATVYWVKMVMDVYLAIKNMVRKEKMWRGCVERIR